MKEIDLLKVENEVEDLKSALVEPENMALNFNSLFEKTDEKFIFDEDSSKVFFYEIIKQVGLSNWEEFTKLCDLPLPWFSLFQFNSTYELQNNNTPELVETNNPFSTFLHLAVQYFPDKYTNYIAQAMIKDKVEMKTMMGGHYINVVLIKDLLVNNSKEAFNTLQHAGYIKNEALMETVFLAYYKECHAMRQKILTNPVMADYLLGDIEKGTESCLKELFKNGCPRNSFNNLSNMLLHIYDACPHKKEEFANLILHPLLKEREGYMSSTRKPYINQIVGDLIAYGFIDLHSVYLKEEKRLANSSDNLSSGDNLPIQQTFNLSPDLIQQTYEKKAELLNEKLKHNKKKPSHIKNKI